MFVLIGGHVLGGVFYTPVVAGGVLSISRGRVWDTFGVGLLDPADGSFQLTLALFTTAGLAELFVERALGIVRE